MTYKVRITIDDESGDIFDCLSAENEQSSPRASTKIYRTAKKTDIRITSADAVSLRASTNSMTKLLAVFEKSKGL